MFPCGFSFSIFLININVLCQDTAQCKQAGEPRLTHSLSSPKFKYRSWLDAAQARFVEVAAMQSRSNKLEGTLETELRSIAQEMEVGRTERQRGY